jgi:hypothetical protein
MAREKSVAREAVGVFGGRGGGGRRRRQREKEREREREDGELLFFSFAT